MNQREQQIKEAAKAIVEKNWEIVVRPWGIDCRGDNQGFTIKTNSWDESDDVYSTIRREVRFLKASKN